MQLWCKCLHAITQCTMVLKLSPKDTHLYLNILPIRSLPEVNFWDFHLKDLTSFLICPLWDHFIFFFFSFLPSPGSFHSYFHFTQPFLQSFFFLTQPWCMKCDHIIFQHPKLIIKIIGCKIYSPQSTTWTFTIHTTNLFTQINNTNASLLPLCCLLNPEGKVIPNTKTSMQSHGQHWEPIDWSMDMITEILH